MRDRSRFDKEFDDASREIDRTGKIVLGGCFGCASFFIAFWMAVIVVFIWLIGRWTGAW